MVLIITAFAEVGLGDQIVVVNDGVQAMDYLLARNAFGGAHPDFRRSCC